MAWKKRHTSVECASPTDSQTTSSSPRSIGPSSGSSAVSRPAGWNIRDIAEVDEQRIHEGLVFRSSQVFDQGAVQELRIRSAIDLRKAGRRESRQAKRHDDPVDRNPLKLIVTGTGAAAGKAAEQLRIKSQSKDRDTSAVGYDTLADAGLQVYHVELLPPRAKLKIFWVVPLRLKLQTLKAVATCHPPEDIMAQAVANPAILGLAKLYCFMLDMSKPYIARALAVFAHEENLPSVMHCTHGKDRTGLLTALLLLALGVDEASVVRDYAVSEDELKSGREGAQRKGEVSAAMVTDDVISSNADIMQQTLAYLRDRYGGISGYLKEIELSADKLRDIRRNLLTPAAFTELERQAPQAEGS